MDSGLKDGRLLGPKNKNKNKNKMKGNNKKMPPPPSKSKSAKNKSCKREKKKLEECKAELEDCVDSNPLIVPTAPLISLISVEATSLVDTGCNNVGGFACDNTPWVYCIDSLCAEPTPDGLSTCDCILQTSGDSRLPPKGDAGANCVYSNTGLSESFKPEIGGRSTDELFGAEMCEAMKEGALISTFGKLSQSPESIPNFADEVCPPETPFTYCWGAICTQTEADKRKRGANAVQCECPYVRAPKVNIQVTEAQCTPEIDSDPFPPTTPPTKPPTNPTCAYLHNGNPSNGTEALKIIIDIWYDETGIKPDLVPTCENFAPSTNLDIIDCADHVNFNGTAPWVYCADAICTPPVDGISNCKCWIQESSESIGPGSPTSGAACVIDFLTFGATPPLVGAELFEKMNEGELYSTFGGSFGNSSFIPEIALEACKPNTPFVYCWGAKCQRDPTDPTIAICRCPQVNTPEGSIIGVDLSQCPAQAGNVCNYVHNGGSRDWAEWAALDDWYDITFPNSGGVPETCEGKDTPIGPIF